MSATHATTLSYVQEPESSESLDWADLVALDLAKFDQPGGKQELAREFTQAIEDVGEFCHLSQLATLTNSGVQASSTSRTTA